MQRRVWHHRPMASMDLPWITMDGLHALGWCEGQRWVGRRRGGRWCHPWARGLPRGHLMVGSGSGCNPGGSLRTLVRHACIHRGTARWLSRSQNGNSCSMDRAATLSDVHGCGGWGWLFDHLMGGLVGVDCHCHSEYRWRAPKNLVGKWKNPGDSSFHRGGIGGGPQIAPHF